MFAALFSFLGGSVFRVIWGELSTWVTAKQDHQHEIERMRLQAELDAGQHTRSMESIRLQAELGVQTIRVKGESEDAQIELQGWSSAVAKSMTPTGIFVVDFWNGIIRPLAASIAIFLWVTALNAQGWKMGDWDKELVGVILGFFFASRMMSKAGK
jgi:hypothetical protein